MIVRKEAKVAVDLKRMKTRAKVNLRHQLKQVFILSLDILLFFKCTKAL